MAHDSNPPRELAEKGLSFRLNVAIAAIMLPELRETLTEGEWLYINPDGLKAIISSTDGQPSG